MSTGRRCSRRPTPSCMAPTRCWTLVRPMTRLLTCQVASRSSLRWGRWALGSGRSCGCFWARASRRSASLGVVCRPIRRSGRREWGMAWCVVMPIRWPECWRWMGSGCCVCAIHGEMRCVLVCRVGGGEFMFVCGGFFFSIRPFFGFVWVKMALRI